jgi:hypothetical protein
VQFVGLYCTIKYSYLQLNCPQRTRFQRLVSRQIGCHLNAGILSTHQESWDTLGSRFVSLLVSGINRVVFATHSLSKTATRVTNRAFCSWNYLPYLIYGEDVVLLLFLKHIMTPFLLYPSFVARLRAFRTYQRNIYRQLKVLLYSRNLSSLKDNLKMASRGRNT